MELIPRSSKKGKKPIKIFFQLREDIAILLNEIAEKNGVSRSEVIRQCIEKTLNIKESTELEF